MNSSQHSDGRSSQAVLGRVATLMTGSILSQLLVLGTTPLLTRLFSPEAFGELGVFTAFGSVLGILVLGCYDRAVLLAKDRYEAARLVWLCLLVVISVSSLFALLLFTLSLFALDGGSTLSPTLRLVVANWFGIVVLAAAIGGFQTLSSWLIYSRQFRSLAGFRFLQSAAQVAMQVSAGFMAAGSLGLMLGLAGGWALASVSMVLHGLGQGGFRLPRADQNRVSLRGLLHRYRDFPRYAMPAELGNALASYLPLIFIGLYFGSADVGYFLITQKAVAAPSAFVGNAIRDVFREQAAAEFRMFGSCRASFLRALRLLVAIGIAPTVVLIFAAPAIFGLVFGEAWRAAGEMVQIMAPMIFMSFLVHPLSQMFNIGERQVLDFALQVALLVSTSVALALGGMFDSLQIALVAMSAVYSIVYGLRIWFSYRIALGAQAPRTAD